MPARPTNSSILAASSGTTLEDAPSSSTSCTSLKQLSHPGVIDQAMKFLKGLGEGNQEQLREVKISLAPNLELTKWVSM